MMLPPNVSSLMRTEEVLMQVRVLLAQQYALAVEQLSRPYVARLKAPCKITRPITNTGVVCSPTCQLYSSQRPLAEHI